MDTVYTVRIDRRTERLVARFAARSGMTRSEVVRQALRSFVEESEAVRGESAFEAVRDLVGCYHSGEGDLSERTGERFRRLLRDRQGGKGGKSGKSGKRVVRRRASGKR